MVAMVMVVTIVVAMVEKMVVMMVVAVMILRKLPSAAVSRPARTAEDNSMSSPRSAWSLLEWSERREAEKNIFYPQKIKVKILPGQSGQSTPRLTQMPTR